MAVLEAWVGGPLKAEKAVKQSQVRPERISARQWLAVGSSQFPWYYLYKLLVMAQNHIANLCTEMTCQQIIINLEIYTSEKKLQLTLLLKKVS